MPIHKIINIDEIRTIAVATSVIKRTQLYICNQAVKPTLEKSSYFWSRVTCKNCLRKRDRK